MRKERCSSHVSIIVALTPHPGVQFGPEVLSVVQIDILRGECVRGLIGRIVCAYAVKVRAGDANGCTTAIERTINDTLSLKNHIRLSHLLSKALLSIIFRSSISHETSRKLAPHLALTRFTFAVRRPDRSSVNAKRNNDTPRLASQTSRLPSPCSSRSV